MRRSQTTELLVQWKCPQFMLQPPSVDHLKTTLQMSTVWPQPQETSTNSIALSTWVFIKVIKQKHWASDRYEGPHRVLLTTPTTVKVEGRNGWIHLSHSKSRELDE
ncbi:hypothetical protein NL108_011916 [Boleophthalmus pectinirostris]|nr:hypothetical protein NL108_011916 [Boleophthalmus pectinirostris]